MEVDISSELVVGRLDDVGDNVYSTEDDSSVVVELSSDDEASVE